MASLFIHSASQLATLNGPNGPRAGSAQGEIGLIENGAVYCEGQRIVDAGPTDLVRSRHPESIDAETTIDAAGHAVLPGLVDCHAHPVFAGDRSDEYAMRLAGKSYREILASGGGILKSVRLTRQATHAELAGGLHQRLNAALLLGTTTMEAKSGYGLDEPTERKILEVIRTAGVPPASPILAGGNSSLPSREPRSFPCHPIDLVPTLLFAHAIPTGMSAGQMVEASIVALSGLAPLAEFIDVFCEKGIFEIEQSRKILEAGKHAGLKVKVHADEMCLLGGARLAASLGAVSADHLLFADDEGIADMRRSGAIAVFLPGTPFVLRVAYADARRWITGQVPVALGSDLNPNCYCESLPFAFALAVYEMKMTPAEALVAVTINAAAAICRENEIGSIAHGKLADIVILKGPSYLHLGYHAGGNPVDTVIKRGRLVVRDGQRL